MKIKHLSWSNFAAQNLRSELNVTHIFLRDAETRQTFDDSKPLWLKGDRCELIGVDPSNDEKVIVRWPLSGVPSVTVTKSVYASDIAWLS